MPYDTPAGAAAFCYFRAAGRSLEAIREHHHAVRQAVEDVRAFVMLCGAERALGGSRISGLHFAGKLPPGWVRNASAPHMAIPDTDTTRGMSFARKMASLRIPGEAEFGELIGVAAQPNSISPNAPLITMAWPSYERLKDGWVIKCPVSKEGEHVIPPDCTPMSEREYRKLSAASAFNLMAADSEDMTDN